MMPLVQQWLPGAAGMPSKECDQCDRARPALMTRHRAMDRKLQMRRRYVLAVQCGCPMQLLPTCCFALARAAALAGGRALVATVHDSSQSVYKVP